MSQYQPYTKHKTSGVDWIGFVPEHWDLKKLKQVADIELSNVDKKSLDGQPQVKLCNYTDVYYNDRISDQLDFMNATATLGQVNKFSLKANDVIITKDSEDPNDIGVPALVEVDMPDVLCGYHLARVRPHYPPDGNFIFRYLQSELSRAYFYCSAKGQTRFGLGKQSITDILIPTPPAKEQEAISNFLDRETARIDALIEKKQRLIELLQEKRQAIITQAVTKGLDPDVPMKDSGVEWLGEVPEHWEVGALKRFYQVIDCKHLTAEFVDDGIPLASIREVQSWEVDLSNAKKTTEEYYYVLTEGGREPNPGDIVYSRNATVGEAALVTKDHERFALGQDVCLLRKLGDQLSEFFMYQLHSKAVLSQLDILMVGATFKRINVDDIRNYAVVRPPSSEQEKIAGVLLKKLERIDSIIEKSSQTIVLLQERRSALITAAVTGQIDLREAI